MNVLNLAGARRDLVVRAGYEVELPWRIRDASGDPLDVTSWEWSGALFDHQQTMFVLWTFDTDQTHEGLVVARVSAVDLALYATAMQLPGDPGRWRDGFWSIDRTTEGVVRPLVSGLVRLRGFV